MKCTSILLPLALNFFLVINASDRNNCSSDPFATDERRLRSKLLGNYDPQVIPLNPPNVTRVTASLNLDLKHILINDGTSTITVTAWVTTMWNDGQLVWNKTDYGDLERIVVSSKNIWTPDLSIYNSDMKQMHLFHDATSCMVIDAGIVACVANLNSPIYCRADLQRWPYDSQTCQLEIGSWAYTGDQLHIEKATEEGYSSVQGIYFENNQWALRKITARNMNDCCSNNTHPFVKWNFEVQRHAGLFEATYVAPAFCCTLMSFWVKTLATRILLCCASLVCNTLILTSLVGQIHASGDDRPNIVLAYRDSLALTLISLVFSVAMPWLQGADSPYLLTKLVDLVKTRGGRPGLMLLGSDLESGSTEELDDGQNERVASGPKCVVFTTFLDRAAFFILLVIYSLMLFALLP
ncbi:acetylcholine receptor subunit alpha-type acr-16-like isoform X2 [Neocloeon triangulifer]|uniref:acetylcholine receptor subunit alpha-type acr-16-like isoform X2 n=1 Tax=Neocloeon triangulifer TaxID=2078957 RepID=UPI00286F7086|nr:acetylcholine receptor subunit alpha-type acr-16-like isoform X2 [Neocloeon triangulifer]